MKRIAGVIAGIVLAAGLAACGGGPKCESGHWQDDWETKKVYKTERYKSNGIWKTKKVQTGTKMVNDRDWVCDRYETTGA